MLFINKVFGLGFFFIFYMYPNVGQTGMKNEESLKLKWRRSKSQTWLGMTNEESLKLKWRRCISHTDMDENDSVLYEFYLPILRRSNRQKVCRQIDVLLGYWKFRCEKKVGILLNNVVLLSIFQNIIYSKQDPVQLISTYFIV